MKYATMLLVVILLSLGGCGRSDLSGLHGLAHTVHSVQSPFNPPASAPADTSAVLAHHASATPKPPSP